jgi:hypothetical protein
MKKMIMMALAGFIWSKFQARVAKPKYAGRTMRRS